MSNPYAPPQAAVRDIVDPSLTSVAADRGTRLGAAILDMFIFVLMVYAPLIVGAGVAGATAQQGAESVEAVRTAVGGGLVLGLIGLIVWSTITIVLMRRNGQSIGKKATGIKVVRSDGSPASLGAADLAAQRRELAASASSPSTVSSTCSSSSVNRASVCTTRSRTRSSSTPEAPT